MPGRHDSPFRSRDGWVSTAFDAVVACAPATSFFAALGLAGGGYLTAREDVAACGAVVGAVGLAVERFQARSVRLRLRRERARYRDDLRGVSRDLHEMQHGLAALRNDLDGVRAERDAVREQLRTTLDALTDARTAPVALDAVPVGPDLAETVAAILTGAIRLPLQASGDAVLDSRPGTAAGGEADAVLAVADLEAADLEAVEPEAVEPEAAELAAAQLAGTRPDADDVRRRAAALGLLVPGQVRSPIATGGIPLLTPGPSERVRVIDVRSDEPITRPLPRIAAQPPVPSPSRTQRIAPATLPAGVVDTMVYAAIADAEADELTRVLEVPGSRAVRHAGVLPSDAHRAAGASDAHLAGDGPILYVVSRGRHVA